MVAAGEEASSASLGIGPLFSDRRGQSRTFNGLQSKMNQDWPGKEHFCELKSHLEGRPGHHPRPDRLINPVRLCFLSHWLSKNSLILLGFFDDPPGSWVNGFNPSQHLSTPFFNF
jgi:hypothetical protein